MGESCCCFHLKWFKKFKGQLSSRTHTCKQSVNGQRRQRERQKGPKEPAPQLVFCIALRGRFLLFTSLLFITWSCCCPCCCFSVAFKYMQCYRAKKLQNESPARIKSTPFVITLSLLSTLSLRGHKKCPHVKYLKYQINSDPENRYYELSFSFPLCFWLREQGHSKPVVRHTRYSMASPLLCRGMLILC